MFTFYNIKDNIIDNIDNNAYIEKTSNKNDMCHVIGVVAQLVEHHNGIVGVVGSIPIGSTSSLFVGAAEPFYVRSDKLYKDFLPYDNNPNSFLIWK